MTATVGDPGVRVAQLLRIYGAGDACAAHLLCDRQDPEAIACTIIDAASDGRHLTYGRLRLRSERLASALSARGVRPGDRVATLMRKGESLVVTLMAIWRLGAVHVPLFTAFAASAVGYRLTASRASAVICDADQAQKIRDAQVDTRLVIVGEGAPAGAVSLEALLEEGEAGFPAAAMGGDAPLIQIYTSGTTGAPKGVQVPIRALASFQIYFEFGLGVVAEDVYWNAADPGWAYGLYYAILAPLAAGIRTLLQTGGFSAEGMVAAIDQYKVTNFAAAPTVYRSLRAAGLRTATRLRCASSAGEPLTPEVNSWAVDALGVEVRDHYGQTECGMLVNNHQHPAVRTPVKPGSMGQAMPGWKVVVLDATQDEVVQPGIPGRLSVDLSESPLAWFRGYVDAPEKTDEKLSGGGRWYLTGDVARTDQDGFFYFASRDDDVIIMAGYRIGPFEVESVILQHEAVAECAVVAAPDAVRGEVLEAVVVLREGYSPSEALTLDIQTRVKTGFAAHAYPRRVHYMDALPKTPSGKVQRFILRQKLREAAPASASHSV